MTTQEKIMDVEAQLLDSEQLIERYKKLIIGHENIVNIKNAEKTKPYEQLKAEQEVYDPNFKPKLGEKYYMLDLKGCIIEMYCKCDLFDEWLYKINNQYKTKAQCEKGKQARLLMAEIREDNPNIENCYLKQVLFEIAYYGCCVRGFAHKIHIPFGDRIQELKDYL